ncbi:hypothetical protein C8R44DRAFT_949591 [Mycena epipterygia]|nr:hypothetical protein C8R44DRAFT_949591 [Mycena epipterygia]
MNLITALLVSFLAVAAANPVVDPAARAVAVDARSVLPRNCETVPTLICTGGFNQEIACTDIPFGCSATGVPPVTSDATCAADCIWFAHDTRVHTSKAFTGSWFNRSRYSPVVEADPWIKDREVATGREMMFGSWIVRCLLGYKVEAGSQMPGNSSQLIPSRTLIVRQGWDDERILGTSYLERSSKRDRETRQLGVELLRGHLVELADKCDREDTTRGCVARVANTHGQWCGEMVMRISVSLGNVERSSVGWASCSAMWDGGPRIYDAAVMKFKMMQASRAAFPDPEKIQWVRIHAVYLQAVERRQAQQLLQSKHLWGCWEDKRHGSFMQTREREAANGEECVRGDPGINVKLVHMPNEVRGFICYLLEASPPALASLEGKGEANGSENMGLRGINPRTGNQGAHGSVARGVVKEIDNMVDELLRELCRGPFHLREEGSARECWRA